LASNSGNFSNKRQSRAAAFVVGDVSQQIFPKKRAVPPTRAAIFIFPGASIYEIYIYVRSARLSNLYAFAPILASAKWSTVMLDAILVAAGAGAFAVAILYSIACERL
jgi:hypothetical protein